MKKHYLIPALCTALVFMAGCVNDFNEDDYVKTSPALMESVVIEGDLAKDIRIIQTSSMKTEDGRELVCIRGRLKRECLAKYVFGSYKSMNISYLFTWWDVQGKKVPCGNVWQNLQLYPGEEFACTSYSPAKEAVKVKLEFKAGTVVSAPVSGENCVKEPASAAQKLQQRELPADIREGKSTTTEAIRAKTGKVEENNKVLKKINQKVDGKGVKNNCLCGCANGETCYCPEGSACPNAGKNKKTVK